MKGMLVVIALGPDSPKLLLQLLGAHDLGHGVYLSLPSSVEEPGSPS
jgi:hypothetical protein